MVIIEANGSKGIFVAHADGSILLATHPIIASEFNDLENSSWLITGFALAGAATQTLVSCSQLLIHPTANKIFYQVRKAK
jgi:hypothetical protein